MVQSRNRELIRSALLELSLHTVRIEVLADYTCLSHRTVRKHLASLAATGEIVRFRRKQGLPYTIKLRRPA
jgi:predicted ArsR family transcriptional regulator